MQCIICKQARGERTKPDVVDRIAFELEGEILHEDICSCPTCGYTWLSPPVPADILAAYYKTQSRWPSETLAYREQMAFMQKYIHPDQQMRVLDIGSYDGRLLCLFENEYPQATLYGVEPDEHATENYTMFSTIEEAVQKLGNNSIDIITMGHVFEHIQDPLEFLALVKSMLTSGGMLMIEVPDLEDPQVQLVPYWTPFHQSYFTPTTLGHMLEVAGFQQQATEKTGYRSTRVIARNFENPVPNWEQAPPPGGAQAGIARDLREREIMVNAIGDKLFSLYPDALAIFGTGDHTYWLLKEFPDLMEHTLTFLDSDPNRHGLYMGTPVIHPDECPDEVDSIICSSYDSQDEMAEAVGKRAVLLYDDVRAYDVWMGEDE